MTSHPSATPIPRFHLVTDDNVLDRPDFLALARQLLSVGSGDLALHLRGPATAARRLCSLAEQLSGTARRAGARLIVNDRVDVLLAAGADGAQLGQRSLSLADARRLLGADHLIGVSVHSTEEAAQADGADFLVVGTLFETPSHPGHPGAGVELIQKISGLVPETPLIGIGGVTPERVPQLLAAGAHGCAVLRGVWDASDPADRLSQYIQAYATVG